MSKQINITIPGTEDVKSKAKGLWGSTRNLAASTKDGVAKKRAEHKKGGFNKMVFSDSRAMRVAAMETIIEFSQGAEKLQKFQLLSERQQDQVIANFQANNNNKEESK